MLRDVPAKEKIMAQPIFIIGSPRSGTSVLTWGIGQHPNISVQPETNWMPTIAHAAFDAYRIGTARDEFSQLSWAHFPFDEFMVRFGQTIDSISRDCFERRLEGAIPNYRQGHYERDVGSSFRLIRSPDERKARWVDGTPAYSFSTYALGLMFPDCKFIHILRRPEQVVNSLAHFENLGHADTRSFKPAQALRVWLRHTLAAKDTAEFYGSAKVLRIDHADLATDGKAVLSRCFAFLGEPDCDYAASTLGQKRINSSNADGERDDTLSKIKDHPYFERAQALYDELKGSEVPAEPDLSALEEQRAAFDLSQHPTGKTAAATAPKTVAGKILSALKIRFGR